MNTEQDLLTLIQTRNQRIAELELKVLDLNRENEELKNALPHNQKENGKGNEEEEKRNEKKEKEVNGK